MNATNLLRCAAATLAASALSFAQSAPLAPRAPSAPSTATAPKARSDGKSADRMQVRLAEVIAMLEEDDLTPEQRAQAKRKLEEIVAKLRETPAPASAPATPVPPTEGTPRAVRSARTPMTTTVEVAPDEPAKASKERVKYVEVEGDSPMVLRRTSGGDFKVAQPVEGRRGVYSVDGTTVITQDPKPKELDKKDVEKLQAEAKKLRAEAEAMRTKIRAMSERSDAEEAEAKKVSGSRMLLEKTRSDAADAKATESVRMGDLRTAEQLYVKRAHDEALVRAKEAQAKEAQAKDEMRVRAKVDEARVRDYSVRAGAQGNKVDFVPGPAKARARDAGDGDAEIKGLIQEMRDEMRAIRELLQQMRKQASQSRQAPRDAGAGQNNALGQGGGTWLGQQPGASTFDWRPGAGGGLQGWSGNGGDAGQGASSGEAPRSPFWSSNKPAEGGMAPFGGFYGAQNTQPGGERSETRRTR